MNLFNKIIYLFFFEETHFVLDYREDNWLFLVEIGRALAVTHQILINLIPQKNIVLQLCQVPRVVEAG